MLILVKFLSMFELASFSEAVVPILSLFQAVVSDRQSLQSHTVPQNAHTPKIEVMIKFLLRLLCWHRINANPSTNFSAPIECDLEAWA